MAIAAIDLSGVSGFNATPATPNLNLAQHASRAGDRFHMNGQ
jgi:hypothetical protein